MACVRALDFSAVLRFVRQLQRAQNLDAFRIHVVKGLRALIGSDLASYNDVDVQARRIVWVSDPIDGAHFPGCQEIISAHMHENPVIAHFAEHRDERWLTISDFLSRRAFQRTTVYGEFYRRIEAEYQIATMFPGHGTAAVGIALDRRRRDFGERDRAALALLLPHLLEGYRSACRFTGLEADIAAMTSGVDHMHLALVVLGERRDIGLATTRARCLLARYFDAGPRATNAVPPALDEWLRRHEAGERDGELPPARTPYVVDRDGRRLIVRLIGERRRRVLVLAEEPLTIDPRDLAALGLTRREAEVLGWLAEGKRDQEIAVILGISPRTVQHHLEHVYDKLGVETRNAAVAVAVRTSAEVSARAS